MTNEDKKEKNVVKTILLVTCIVGLIVGIMLWASSATTETYELEEFRFSREARYIDKTENLLKDNEKCKIEGDKITVTTVHEGLYRAGMILTLLFGTIDGLWLWQYFSER